MHRKNVRFSAALGVDCQWEEEARSLGAALFDIVAPSGIDAPVSRRFAHGVVVKPREHVFPVLFDNVGRDVAVAVWGGGHEVECGEIGAVPIAWDFHDVAGCRFEHWFHPGGGGLAEVGVGCVGGVADVHCPVGLGVVGEEGVVVFLWC